MNMNMNMNKPFALMLVGVALLGNGGFALAAEPGHDSNVVAAPQGVPATGTVKSVDAAAGKAVIAHDPIPALKWPAMTMDFRLADKTLAGKVKAGDKVKFTLTPGDKGSYTVTAIEPMP